MSSKTKLCGALAALGLISFEAASQVQTVPGMPPVIDPKNLYSETVAGKMSPALADHRELVYVPHVQSNDVYVIDPKTYTVIDKYKVGLNPQHVVPSWDMETLWVTNNAERTTKGSLTPIDPKTGKPGKEITVHDPYNMYFSPDGQHAIVVEEAEKRLASATPRRWSSAFHQHPRCAGINHADFSIDGRFAIFTCEFSKGLTKIDLVDRKVVGHIQLSKGGMPQDIRASPDGKRFYVADMRADGLFIVDFETFKEVGFIETGKGTHGLYPSRDAKRLFVANRGAKQDPRREGRPAASRWSTSHREDEATGPPGGGSRIWETSAPTASSSGYRGATTTVYVFDSTGAVKTIKVGIEPHGLTVWPQPGATPGAHRQHEVSAG